MEEYTPLPPPVLPGPTAGTRWLGRGLLLLTGGALVLLVYLIWGPASPRADSTPVPGEPGAFISAEATVQGWEESRDVVVLRLEHPGGWFEASREERIGVVPVPGWFARNTGKKLVAFRWCGPDELAVELNDYPGAVVVLTRAKGRVVRAQWRGAY